MSGKDAKLIIVSFFIGQKFSQQTQLTKNRS